MRSNTDLMSSWRELSKFVEAGNAVDWHDYVVSLHLEVGNRKEKTFIRFSKRDQEQHRNEDTFSKLHVALQDKDDMECVFRSVIGVLFCEKIAIFKVILESKFDEMQQSDQAGKLFTIYFNEHNKDTILKVAEKIERQLKTIFELTAPEKTAANSMERLSHRIDGYEFVTMAGSRVEKILRGKTGSTLTTTDQQSRASSMLMPVHSTLSTFGIAFWSDVKREKTPDSISPVMSTSVPPAPTISGVRKVVSFLFSDTSHPHPSSKSPISSSIPTVSSMEEINKIGT